MKQALLVHPSTNPLFNIGDYVQAIAASQFFPSSDFLYIDRENLSNYNGETTALIMNGWFMFSQNWPPSDKINPHYVAFHINSSADDVLLSDRSIEHLKKYEPIGCRDTRSRDILRAKGVDAYFSGCLTLTLGKSYQNNGKGKKYYIVDPIIEPQRSFYAILSYVWTCISQIKKILCIYNKVENRAIMSFIKTVIFYNQYSKIISDEVLLNAEYPSVYVKNNFANEKEKFDCARNFLERYSKAKLVITSRIHCQMPCIAMNTPVIFLKNANDIKSSFCRFGGLTDLYNIISYNKGKFDSDDVDLLHKINGNTKIINKNNHHKIVHNLESSCLNFIRNIFNFKI